MELVVFKLSLVLQVLSLKYSLSIVVRIYEVALVPLLPSEVFQNTFSLEHSVYNLPLILILSLTFILVERR